MNKRCGCFHGLDIFSLLLIICALWGGILAGCVQTGNKSGSPGLDAQDGLPVDISKGKLKAGLEVIYFHEKYAHISDLPTSKAGIAKYGHPGAPILKLDYQFGKGEVFGSGRSREVGMLMTGYIHLDKPGEYLFKAKSNDGFELAINGTVVVSDPKVHADRMSDPGAFKVVKGGLFPVEIKYFQRKGTAALQLFWQRPGVTYFKIVPAGVYAHFEK